MDDRLKRKVDDTARTISWKIMLQSAHEAIQDGNYTQAEKLYLRALERAETRMGVDDVLVGHILMEVADFYLSQNKHAKAQECYLRVRQILADHARKSPNYDS